MFSLVSGNFSAAAKSSKFKDRKILAHIEIQAHISHGSISIRNVYPIRRNIKQPKEKQIAKKGNMIGLASLSNRAECVNFFRSYRTQCSSGLRKNLKSSVCTSINTHGLLKCSKDSGVMIG